MLLITACITTQPLQFVSRLSLWSNFIRPVKLMSDNFLSSIAFHFKQSPQDVCNIKNGTTVLSEVTSNRKDNQTNPQGDFLSFWSEINHIYSHFHFNSRLEIVCGLALERPPHFPSVPRSAAVFHIGCLPTVPSQIHLAQSVCVCISVYSDSVQALMCYTVSWPAGWELPGSQNRRLWLECKSCCLASSSAALFLSASARLICLQITHTHRDVISIRMASPHTNPCWCRTPQVWF